MKNKNQEKILTLIVRLKYNKNPLYVEMLAIYDRMNSISGTIFISRDVQFFMKIILDNLDNDYNVKHLILQLLYEDGNIYSEGKRNKIFKSVYPNVPNIETIYNNKSFFYQDMIQKKTTKKESQY